jgi:hypothetical protein
MRSRTGPWSRRSASGQPLWLRRGLADFDVRVDDLDSCLGIVGVQFDVGALDQLERARVDDEGEAVEVEDVVAGARAAGEGEGVKGRPSLTWNSRRRTTVRARSGERRVLSQAAASLEMERAGVLSCFVAGKGPSVMATPLPPDLTPRRI